MMAAIDWPAFLELLRIDDGDIPNHVAVASDWLQERGLLMLDGLTPIQLSTLHAEVHAYVSAIMQYSRMSTTRINLRTQQAIDDVLAGRVVEHVPEALGVRRWLLDMYATYCMACKGQGFVVMNLSRPARINKITSQRCEPCRGIGYVPKA